MNDDVASAKFYTDFIECLFMPDDLVELRLIHPKGNIAQEFIRAADATTREVFNRLAELNADGHNVYIGANPRLRHGGKREDVQLARSLFVDIDNVSHLDDAIERVWGCGLPIASLVLSSGHGLHAYWRLREPIYDLEQWSCAQRQIISLLNSDERIHDAPRVMRLPGFINHKPPVSRCELLCVSDDKFTLASLLCVAHKANSLATFANSSIDINELLSAALNLAKKGNRNDTGFRLACQLRDRGVSQGEAKATLEAFATKQDADYTEQEALAAVASAYSRPPRDSIVLKSDEEAELVPIEEGEALPDLMPDAFCGWAADYILALSESKEVSPTFGLMLLMPVLASTCQRRFNVLIEPGYLEPLCIYTAPALESGERKTAVHHPIVKPIMAVQHELRERAKGQQGEAKLRREWAEKQCKMLEKDMLESLTTGDREETARIQGEIIKLLKDAPEQQELPQLVIEDFTEAALSVALTNNGESLLVTSDEGGLFDNLGGRFNDRPEIDLFLKAHIGSPHTINRTGRENVFLARPLLSVGISPQPGVLARLGSVPGFSDRGLLARFLWALPRSSVGQRRLTAKPIPPKVDLAYMDRLQRMAKAGHEFSAPQPYTLELSPEAYSAWKTFQRDLEPRMGERGDLQLIKPWASKLAGAVARIAAVAHAAKFALTPQPPTKIELEQVEGAVRLGQALIPHAMATHRLMFGGSRKTALAVVRHLNANGWPREPRSISGWWRQVRKIVGESSSAFEPVARVLVDHGYLIESPRPTMTTGRPGTYFRSNLRLLQ